MPLLKVRLTFQLYVAFDSYLDGKGKKRLQQLDVDLRRLVGVRNENLLVIHAIKMTIPQSHGKSRLAILCDQRPPSTLHDVFAHCDYLPEDRAIVSFHLFLQVFVSLIKSMFSGVHQANSVWPSSHPPC